VSIDDDFRWRAFTADKVTKLTGLSRRQLQYWDEQRFLSPSVSSRGGRGKMRLYSFRDLVSLRAAAALRRDGISLQQIRRVVEHLQGLDYREPLAELRCWSAGDGKLYFAEAGTVRQGRRPDQTLVEVTVPVPAIVGALEQAIVQLDTRRVGSIERRRGALGSKPVIAGTRIPVSSIRRLAADGADVNEILALYPDLTTADVAAALTGDDTPRLANVG
jgi:DNA-binding transcriptional MerR regulator